MDTTIISWIGMAASLLRAYMLANNRMAAIKFSVLLDLWWVMWAVLTQTYALLALNVIYVVLDVRSIWCWSKESSEIS